MANKRKRGDYAGWFAEIPRELKEQFTSMYPNRRDIKLFTVAFVSWAVRVKPDIHAFALKEGWVNDDGETKLVPTPDGLDDDRRINVS